jgi:hypothetical protein
VSSASALGVFALRELAATARRFDGSKKPGVSRAF